MNGIGKIQLAILTEMRRYQRAEHLRVRDLVERIYKTKEPTATQYVSVARAVRSLEKRGDVEVSPLPGMRGEKCWTRSNKTYGPIINEQVVPIREGIDSLPKREA